ncbi:MAG: 3'(2'),5'-bisphosphate nucleotidase CysQ [Xanthomonadaceae bacterium]|nr:3'(2'),5'-bisphosphate nucleotidase CysQ [Xanthomonadaceae bacterium]
MAGQAGVRVDDGLRDGVIAVAEAAAADILAIYARDFDVEHKQDATPLTEADLAAHRRIVAGLAALTPEIPVLSEESAEQCFELRKGWARYWLVDPLDGTREFVKKNGEFSVNIALIDDGIAVFGVIQQPVTGLVWHGAPGQGAFRREQGRDTAIQARIPVRAPLRIAASRSHRDARTEGVIARFSRAEVVGLGSSLKFCRIAEGSIDLYPRFGPTSEWDTAAGQAILEAAGGAVVDSRGRPLRYNQRETLLNGDFFASGDPALLGEVMA